MITEDIECYNCDHLSKFIIGPYEIKPGLIVPNLPYHKCTYCGEVTFSSTAMQMLDKAEGITHNRPKHNSIKRKSVKRITKKTATYS